MSEHVHCEVIDGVGHITFTRVGKRNAITRDMMSVIVDTLGMYGSDDDVAAVIVSGEEMFSAGWDRNEMLVTDSTSWDQFVEVALAFYRAMFAFPKPLIAAVEQYALGTAFDVVLMCDIRISSDGARFAHPEVRAGGVALFTPLKQVVGDGWARELCLTGREIEAHTAERIGFVTRVVPPGEALSEARAAARDIAAVPAATIAYTKAFLWSHPGPEDYLPVELDHVMRSRLTIH